MAELKAYCWRKRLLFETSGPDNEMAWIDELANDISEDPQLLEGLIVATIKLKRIDQYLRVIENLSWYAAIKYRIDSDLLTGSVYSVLLETDLDCTQSRSSKSTYTAQIATALQSKMQLIEALEIKPFQSA